MTVVDYQVGAGEDDGIWYDTYFYNATTDLNLGSTATLLLKLFCRWPRVTIPNGASITAAYISFYYSGCVGTPPECDLYFEDAANPSAISSASDGDGRTKTANTIKITSPSSGTWWNSNSITSIIQELVDSYSYALGAAMQLVVIGPTPSGADNRGYAVSYNANPGRSAKLHIEYTEAAGGDPEGSLIGCKLLRGGLLLHGVLGR